jgi:hypothetical protein
LVLDLARLDGDNSEAQERLTGREASPRNPPLGHVHVGSDLPAHQSEWINLYSSQQFAS